MIRKRYHLIYKTTNVITQKYYIGMHSTDDLDDGYLGSGNRLRNSINKYGIDNHKCEILEYLPNRKMLAEREAEIVNEDLIKDEMCMNIKQGGHGGFDPSSTAGTDGFIKKFKNNKKFRADVTNHLKGISNKGVAARMKKYPEGIFKGRTHTEETKRKMSESSKGTQAGKRNSQYGTCWIYSLSLQKNKKIKKEDLDMWTAKGWIKGRKYF